jgi:electron transfer flavoprotein beta subunit
VAAALGALLGMPVVAGVEEVSQDSGRVLARRKVGADVETLAATPPVLIAVAAVSAEKDIPGMKQLLAARQRPIDTVSADEAGAPAPGADAVTAIGSRATSGRTAHLFDGDAADAARHLVAALRGDGTL